MLMPVRCWTCGKVLGDLAEKYEEKRAKGESSEKAFDELGVERYCCKRMILSNENLIDEILPYPRV
jgi:DNA-directed RNA polymerase subunit N